MIYYSQYNPAIPTSGTATGVAGTSLIDLTSTSFAQMFANATDYNASTTYSAGNLVYNQNSVWVYVNTTSGAGNPPPTLPTISNAYWELIGSAGTFTWIAYADCPAGFSTLSTVAVAGTAGQFTCTSTTLAVNDIVTVTGTLSGTATISEYSDSKNYIISATNGSTSFTLKNADGTPLVTTVGTTAGLTFTKYTITNFTTGAPGTRTYIGVAPNKTSATEGINIADYNWSKFVGADGTSGVSPLYISINKPTVGIPTDTDGLNQVYTASADTRIYVAEGQTTLEYDGIGTSNGTWKITSATVLSGTIAVGTLQTDTASYAIYGAVSGMTTDSATIEYTVQGKNGSGVAFSGLKVTQTFNKIKGGVIDTIAPAVPVGLGLSSSTITTPAGDIQIKLTASWTANTEPDLSYYIVAIQEAAGSFIEYTTTSNAYEWFVKPNTSYTVKVRAVDKSANKSAFCTAVSQTSTKDSAAPAAPTNVASIAAFKNVYISWTNPSDTDLEFIEVWRNTSTNSGTATKIATIGATYSTPGAFSDSSTVNGTVYYYWLKAVDSSGNVSGFSTLTNTALSTVTITGTAGQFSCASTTLKLGQVIVISGTFGGTGSITGYTNPTSYVISATNGSTTFTLVKTDGTPLVTTAGTPTGLTYTKYDSASVPAAVGAADIIAGSITADRIKSGEITSDLIAVGTGLNANIQVGNTGVTIGNPIGLIENSPTATTISPGKIKISGTTTLTSWINGTDTTKIEGGSIAANTIAANSMQIGTRGIDIIGIEFQCSVDASGNPTNIVTWSGGTISYINDAGAVTPVTITGGNTGTWAAGTTMYIYWTKGGTTLEVTTSSGTAYTANTIVLATYGGSRNLVVNYGRTIIDGAQITAGTITGDRVKANTITASNIDSRGLSIKDASGNIIFAAGAVDFSNLATAFPNSTNATSISNSNITISGGAINGIGTGSGTLVANSQITINANGTLSGAGSGQVTLPGLGNYYFRISATGNSATSNGGLATGFYVGSSTTALTTGGRSYTVVKILRSSGAATVVGTYDVFGSTANATAMASALNAINSDYIVIVFSADEPQTNRLFGTLPAAMYRHGASRAIFGSSNFRYRSAYILIGIGGCGEGNGAELYQGSVDNDTSAWVDGGFSIINGVLSGVSTSAVPKSLSDYGYTGDLNATYGATLGGSLTGTFTQSSWNTYISSVKINQANIDYLDASIINSGTINTSRLNIDGITLTNGGGALQVAGNGIDTFQIKNDATARIALATPTDVSLGSGHALSTVASLSNVALSGTGKVIIDCGLTIVTYGTVNNSFVFKRRVTGTTPSGIWTNTGLSTGYAATTATNSMSIAGNYANTFNIGDSIKIGSSLGGQISSVTLSYNWKNGTYATYIYWTTAITWTTGSIIYITDDGYTKLDNYTGVHVLTADSNGYTPNSAAVHQHLRLVDTTVTAAGSYDYIIYAASGGNTNAGSLQNIVMSVQEVKKVT